MSCKKLFKCLRILYGILLISFDISCIVELSTSDPLIMSSTAYNMICVYCILSILIVSVLLVDFLGLIESSVSEDDRKVFLLKIGSPIIILDTVIVSHYSLTAVNGMILLTAWMIPFIEYFLRRYLNLNDIH